MSFLCGQQCANCFSSINTWLHHAIDDESLPHQRNYFMIHYRTYAYNQNKQFVPNVLHMWQELAFHLLKEGTSQRRWNNYLMHLWEHCMMQNDKYAKSHIKNFVNTTIPTTSWECTIKHSHLAKVAGPTGRSCPSEGCPSWDPRRKQVSQRTFPV